VALGRVAQEARLTVECLSRDLSGNLPELASGGKQSGRLVGQMAAAGPELRLCYDMNGDKIADWASPDVVVTYHVDSDQLVRTYDGLSSFIVAEGVDQMQLTDLSDSIQIDLTFCYRDLTKTYHLVSEDP
jgi:hypothetical protein